MLLHPDAMLEEILNQLIGGAVRIRDASLDQDLIGAMFGGERIWDSLEAKPEVELHGRFERFRFDRESQPPQLLLSWQGLTATVGNPDLRPVCEVLFMNTFFVVRSSELTIAATLIDDLYEFSPPGEVSLEAVIFGPFRTAGQVQISTMNSEGTLPTATTFADIVRLSYAGDCLTIEGKNVSSLRLPGERVRQAETTFELPLGEFVCLRLLGGKLLLQKKGQQILLKAPLAADLDD